MPHTVGYTMSMPDKRKYISIYFSDGRITNRTKSDLTVAFDSKDPLYAKCKKCNSTEIKKLIEIDSYLELQYLADEDGRSLGNFVKNQLRKKLYK